MRHPRTEAWEARLQQALDKVDEDLEETYGTRYGLHPARLPRGRAANRKYDGLFQLGASFTAGFGSKLGPGYVLDVRLATLDAVPEAVKQTIVEHAVRHLRHELHQAFPNRKLHVARDGAVYKIVGDLRLS